MVNFKFLMWALVLVASLTSVGLCTRILALKEVPVSQSLMVRGVTCFILVLFFAWQRKLSLRPKSIKTQCFRAVLAGLALTFFSFSYNWLSASAVSVLSNIDVPLLIILGSFVGVRSSRNSKMLSLFSVAFLVWYLSGFELREHLFYGLATLMLGTVLLCFGYLYLKKSMNEENEAIAILTPALAIIFFGGLESICGVNLSSWSFSLFITAALSGVGMFGAYIATMRLYAVTDLASAEFPTLLASIVIQPLEFIFLSEPLQLIYLLSSIGFVAMTYFILNLQKNIPEAVL